MTDKRDNHEEFVIDIEKIMDKIRADIAARGFADDCLSFDEIKFGEYGYLEDISFDLQDLEYQLTDYAKVCNISPYHEIRSRGGVFGKLIILFKRLVRKCINFYVTPIVHEINGSNRFVLEMFKSCRDIAKRYRLEEERVDAIELEVKNGIRKSFYILEQKVGETNKQNQELKKAIKVLEDEINMIKATLAK